MARTIWKFPLSGALGANEVVEMPAGAEILTASMHPTSAGPILCAWAAVDPGAPEVMRRFHYIGTGHEAPEGARYLTTIQAIMESRVLVTHVFVSPEEAA